MLLPRTIYGVIIIFLFQEENLPVYDVRAVAEALEITPKQLDNLLSRYQFVGLDRHRRGVTRRISIGVAATVKLGWELATALQMPMSAALRLAERIERSEGAVWAGNFAELRVDLAGLKAVLSARLDAAVETVGRRPRGRPPRSAPARERAHEA